MKVFCGSILAVVSAMIYLLDKGDAGVAVFIGVLATYLIISGAESK